MTFCRWFEKFTSLLILALLAGCAGVSTRGDLFSNQGARVARSVAAAEVFAPSADELSALAELRMKEVPEFVAIAEWANTRGVRVWLGGGSAAGYLHHVRNELEGDWAVKHGAPNPYAAKRIAYGYYDIYRSTQDADIILDADEKLATELEQYLESRFSYLQGSKTVWEVRLLNHPRGSGAGRKDPLLVGDFLNQNSDSHSTGLYELSASHTEESRIRDLFDWKNQKDSQFLKDVLARELHFYRNALHSTTSRARAGMNPEILSVIRYFTKAFQYGLRVRGEDESALRGIIEAFDPAHPAGQIAKNSDYVISQIAKNSLKLYGHSKDLESSRNELDRFGLREKLRSFAKKNDKTDLGVMLEREPLRSYPLGEGPGKAKRGAKTAKELGLTSVAHETSDFLAYESITRSAKGKANVFSSSSKRRGEAAAFGEGFYTRIGREGARGTGLTIRYLMHPNAVEGRDFFFADGENDYVVILNANALLTVDETQSIDAYSYFKMLLSSQVKESDQGILEAIRLRVHSKMDGMTAGEFDELSERAIRQMNYLATDVTRMPDPFLRQWISMALRRGLSPSLRQAMMNLYDRLMTIPEGKQGPIGFWKLIPKTLNWVLATGVPFEDDANVERFVKMLMVKRDVGDLPHLHLGESITTILNSARFRETFTRMARTDQNHKRPFFMYSLSRDVPWTITTMSPEALSWAIDGLLNERKGVSDEGWISSAALDVALRAWDRLTLEQRSRLVERGMSRGSLEEALRKDEFLKFVQLDQVRALPSYAVAVKRLGYDPKDSSLVRYCKRLVRKRMSPEFETYF